MQEEVGGASGHISRVSTLTQPIRRKKERNAVRSMIQERRRFVAFGEKDLFDDGAAFNRSDDV